MNWVSVKDQFPTTNDIVLVYLNPSVCALHLFPGSKHNHNASCTDTVVSVSYWDDEQNVWMNVAWREPFESTITHWMPLPKGPE